MGGAAEGAGVVTRRCGHCSSLNGHNADCLTVAAASTRAAKRAKRSNTLAAFDRRSMWAEAMTRAMEITTDMGNPNGVDFNWAWDFNPEHATAIVLALALSEFSEHTYCAGWLDGLEFQIWDEIHRPGPAAPDVGVDRASSGDLRLTDRERAFFRGLSNALGGGWVARRADADHDLRGDFVEGCGGVVFVTAEQWAELRAERPAS